jgi:DNA-binding Lrp family transcriptional regulator
VRLAWGVSATDRATRALLPFRLRPGATRRECSSGRRELCTNQGSTDSLMTPPGSRIVLEGQIGRMCQRAMVALRVRPHSRENMDGFWRYALELPEVIALQHHRANDFLVHVGMADMDGLRDFMLDRITVRPEVGHVESHLIYSQQRRPALEPLYD